MPFTPQQFLDVFAAYNEAVFPMQVVLLVAALLSIRLAANGASKTTAAILSFLWLWMGVVYHWLFFTQINGMAYVFGAGFVLQSVALFYSGVVTEKLSFGRQGGIRAWVGTSLIVYALLIYPLIGIATGHPYPYGPTFGLPCPTTIFTIGLLLRSGRKMPGYLLVIPVLWSLVASSAAYLLGVWEDFVLLIAAGSVVWLVMSTRVPFRFHAARLGLTPTHVEPK